MRLFFIIFYILFFTSVFASELTKPNPKLLPQEVVSIVLKALQNNDIPYTNAGIKQTWEFAHPSNRMVTGPLNNFISMISSPTYSIMLNHKKHEIIPIKEESFQSIFQVELLDQNGYKVGFYWVVEKVMSDGIFKECWMTTSVSPPIELSKPA